MIQELNFTKLIAWQKSFDLAHQAYLISNSFPKYEQFGLADQIRRCSSSIPANIAEGYSQNTKQLKYRYYTISRGSLTELQNHLLLANKVGYITTTRLNELISLTQEVHKLINKMLSTIKSWS